MLRKHDSDEKRRVAGTAEGTAGRVDRNGWGWQGQGGREGWKGMGGYWCRSDLIELPERATGVAAVGLSFFRGIL